MARWEEALDAQLDIYRSTRSQQGRAYLTHWAESARATGSALWAPLYQNLSDRVAAMAFNAEPCYVDPDLMTVYEAALETFQPEPLLVTDMVVPAGMVLLPRPILTTDIHGKTVTYRALLWHPQSFRIEYPQTASELLVVDTPAPVRVSDHHVSIPVRKDGRRLAYDGLVLALFHDSRDKDDYSLPPGDPREHTGLYLDHILPWGFGSAWDDTVGDAPNAVTRHAQALWRLMAQRIAVRTTERASAPFRHRWARERWPEKQVTVIRLRRPHQTAATGEARHVDWSHRWVVRWHWRNQPYRSTGTVRQILIGSYVKGPADKPLVVNPRVFELVR